ncbi:MAG: hypothetical protein ACXWZS_14280 [Gemmatirosa sp.]
MTERDVNTANSSNSSNSAPAGREPTANHDDGGAHRRTGGDPLFQVRTADLEPYIGLRYLSKLFRLIALILVLLLVTEVVTGLLQQGLDAIPTLVSEASRLIVLAGLLWGIGDLALVLIDVGHDVRATRILLGRQVAHLVQHGQDTRPAREPGA